MQYYQKALSLLGMHYKFFFKFLGAMTLQDYIKSPLCYKGAKIRISGYGFNSSKLSYYEGFVRGTFPPPGYDEFLRRAPTLKYLSGLKAIQVVKTKRISLKYKSIIETINFSRIITQVEEINELNYLAGNEILVKSLCICKRCELKGLNFCTHKKIQLLHYD